MSQSPAAAYLNSLGERPHDGLQPRKAAEPMKEDCSAPHRIRSLASESMTQSRRLADA